MGGGHTHGHRYAFDCSIPLSTNATYKQQGRRPHPTQFFPLAFSSPFSYCFCPQGLKPPGSHHCYVYYVLHINIFVSNAFLVYSGDKEMAGPCHLQVEFLRILVPKMYEDTLVCVLVSLVDLRR